MKKCCIKTANEVLIEYDRMLKLEKDYYKLMAFMYTGFALIAILIITMVLK